MMSPIGGRYNVFDLNDVLMVEVPDQLDLAERALGINGVLKCAGDLFYGDLVVDEQIASRAAICMH